MSTAPELIVIPTLERDVRRAAATLGRDEARFLVDTYYQLQEFRIASTGQVRSIRQNKTKEPHETLGFFGEQFSMLEKQVRGALDHYSNSSELGQWARQHIGIGPVIAAGLLAHIDVTRAPYASSVWRLAGLAPGQRKQKGVKRDWNANLKVLCWKIGDSFVKFSGNEKCYYGHLYRERKGLELHRDAQVRSIPKDTLTQDQLQAIVDEQGGVVCQDNVLVGGNAAEAVRTLETLNIRDKDTKAKYESGHLPDGRIDMRARRYAVKRYLLHYWEAAWWLEYGTPPPNPYVHEHMGHVHKEPCPIPYPRAA